MRTVAQALQGHPQIINHYIDTRYKQTGISSTMPLNTVEDTNSRGSGGFCWSESKEGHDFWDQILMHGNFDIFYNKYPKNSLKPVGEVSSLLDTLQVKTLSTFD